MKHLSSMNMLSRRINMKARSKIDNTLNQYE